MQASTALCLVLLRSRTFISNLIIEDFASPSFCHILFHIKQLEVDLLAAAGTVTPSQFTSSAADTKQHMQLLLSTCALIVALVTKLTMLEAEPHTAGMSQIVGSITVAQTAYKSMFFLLHTCATMFRSWPPTWPVSVHAQYIPVRDAMQIFTQFIFSSTRSRSSMWCITVRGMADCPAFSADKFLAVPLSYISSITDWPGPPFRMLEEVDALPCEFFAMACCVLLGQVEEEEGMILSAAAAHSQQQPGSLIFPQSSLVDRIRTLGCSLHFIFKSAVRFGPIKVVQGLVTPAVVMLFKYIIIVCTSQPGKHSKEAGYAMQALTAFLEVSEALKDRAAQEPSMDQFLSNCGHWGECLRPKYRLRMPVSDVTLMQLLLKNEPASASNVQVRYGLVADILKGWKEDTGLYTPFPSPTTREQVMGMRLAAYHCLAATKSWLQHQVQLRVKLDPASFCTPFSQTMMEQTHTIVRAVFMNHTMQTWVAWSEDTEGGCLFQC